MSAALLNLSHTEKLLDQGHTLTVRRLEDGSYVASIAGHNGHGPTPGSSLTTLDAYLWRTVFAPGAHARAVEANQSGEVSRETGGAVGSASSSYKGRDKTSNKPAPAQPAAKERKRS